jgi:hypothetical protein
MTLAQLAAREPQARLLLNFQNERGTGAFETSAMVRITTRLRQCRSEDAMRSLASICSMPIAQRTHRLPSSSRQLLSLMNNKEGIHSMSFVSPRSQAREPGSTLRFSNSLICGSDGNATALPCVDRPQHVVIGHTFSPANPPDETECWFCQAPKEAHPEVVAVSDLTYDESLQSLYSTNDAGSLDDLDVDEAPCQDQPRVIIHVYSGLVDEIVSNINGLNVDVVDDDNFRCVDERTKEHYTGCADHTTEQIDAYLALKNEMKTLSSRPG